MNVGPRRGTTVKAHPRPLSVASALVFLVLCISSAVFAETSAERLAAGKIIAVIPADAPPTYFRDEETGRATGFAVDIMDAVARRAGLRVEYVFGDEWQGIVQKIDRGEADAIPLMGVTEQRRHRLAFTPAVDSFPIVFFLHAHKDAPRWTPEGRTVGVIAGSAAHEALENRPGLRFRMYDSFEIAMHDLLAGKIDAFACPAPIFLQLARKADIEDHFKMVDPPIEVLQRAVAVRIDNTALLDRLNSAMKNFSSSEEYRRIYVAWHGEPRPFWTTTRVVAAAAFSILLTFGVMAVWRYRSLLRLNRQLAATISERDRARAAQQESESKYRKIFENVQDVICQTDIDGNFIDVSPSIGAYTGYSREELIGKPSTDFYADPADRAPLLRALMTAGRVSDYELALKTKDGRLIHSSVNAHLMLDADGRPAGIEAALRDITDRKRAEDAVRNAKEEWERTFDAIADPVMILDTGFRIVKANRAMAGALGVEPAEAVGMTCYRSVHGMEEPPGYCPHARLLLDGRSGSQEIYEPRIGGHFLVSVSPLFAEDGRVIGSVHAARNISDIKHAEEVLRRSEKRLSDITTCLGEGLYVTDHDGMLTFMNPEAERLLGWTGAELMGRNIHDVVHCRRPDGTYLSFAECPIHVVVATGERFVSGDEVFIRRDGTIFPVSLVAAPLLEDNKQVASITSFRDISERKKLEQERERLVSELQKALAEIKTLHGVLPICSYCRKIRDDKGAWTNLESYISEHTDALFSHGLCRECALKMYPEYFREDQEAGSA